MSESFNYDLFINKFTEQDVSIQFLSKHSGTHKTTIWHLLRKHKINIGIESLRGLEKALLLQKGDLLL